MRTSSLRTTIGLVLGLATLTACATVPTASPPYDIGMARTGQDALLSAETISDKDLSPEPTREVERAELVGQATWYGQRHHGRTTANGESFDMYGFTAAHKTLPFGTVVKVVEVGTRKSVVVRVNDRGPFRSGRIIDLSYAAAREIEITKKGVTQVELEIVHWGDGARGEKHATSAKPGR